MHAHVPSISLPDCYLSTPRMVMSVIIMQCVARTQIGSTFFPTLHSFNVVLARPRSVHLASSQEGATIEQCAQHVQESEVARLMVSIRNDAPVLLCLCSRAFFLGNRVRPQHVDRRTHDEVNRVFLRGPHKGESIDALVDSLRNARNCVSFVEKCVSMQMHAFIYTFSNT